MSPIHYIKKKLPTRDSLKKNQSISFLHRFLDNDNLWHFNCHSVSTAISIGFFVGYLPFPGHMILAACLAILWQANLPLAIAGVWISNPITIPPMFFFAYELGAHILHRHPEVFHFEDNFEWFVKEFEHIIEPLLLGSIICGLMLAIMGNLIVRAYYKFSQ